jgi:c(7)-type cytochrome triheme protein
MRNWCRWSRAAWAFGIAGVIGLGLLACTSQNPVMTTFFEGVPDPGTKYEPAPVVKEPRRPKYVKPPPRVTYVEVPDLPPAVDWKGIYATLTRNDDVVSWVKALEANQITPKPGIAPDAKDEDVLELDVELDSTGEASKAVFPHKAHTLWMGCTTCHTSIFEMEKGKAKMNMAAMGEGQWCGVCHGKVASPDLNTCGACHPGMR